MGLDVRDEECDAVLNGLAHAAALYEQMPAHWVRIGEPRIVRDILERFAPPPRRQCDSAVPLPLRAARKHVAKLFKRGAP
jgi:hypothetical protein